MTKKVWLWFGMRTGFLTTTFALKPLVDSMTFCYWMTGREEGSDWDKNQPSGPTDNSRRTAHQKVYIFKIFMDIHLSTFKGCCMVLFIFLELSV